MSWSRSALDISRVRVYPLAERRSLMRADDILVDPASAPPPLEAARPLRSMKRLPGSVTLAAEGPQ